MTTKTHVFTNMKRSLVLLLFAFYTVFAQDTKEIMLQWTPKNDFIFGSTKYVIPQFQRENLEYNPSEKTLFFVSNFKTEQLVSESNYQITNVVFEPINVDELTDLNLSKLPNDINFKLKSSFAREEPMVFLSFNPIVKEGTLYKKVKQLTLSYTTNQMSRNINQNSISAVQNSVLATGNWFRFYVKKSGIYKVSKTFLRELGFDVNVDPRKIKIYGNGGRMLPLQNNVSYPNDLEENAILFTGENDGVFNDEDYILFYAEGVDNWNTESLTHENLFADNSYYYVTSGGINGKRIQNYVAPTGTPTLQLTAYDGYEFYEKDLVNPGKIGRRWFGEAFDLDNDQTFNFELPNYVSGSNVILAANFCAISFGSTSFKVKANGVELAIVPINTLTGTSGVLGFENILNHSFVPTGSAVAINLTYNNGGVPSSKGYLDYIVLKYNASLKGYGKQFRFSNGLVEANIGVGEFTLTNATSVNAVWDITDIYNVTKIDNSQATLAFKTTLGQPKKFIALDLNDVYTPAKEALTRIANQNLKGTIFQNSQGNFQDVDYLIITPSSLSGQAESLAALHRSKQNLNTKVVSLESIYQEFGGGKQDVTAIRNFIKYVYTNASTPSKRLKYVNLFGDASYDYKDRIRNNTNVVPIFHGFYPASSLTQNNSTNFSLFSSFMSDDFFVMMDDNEGDMQTNADGLDIAVGRMLVSSSEQAAEMVNKVYEYYDEKSYGRWRNNLVYYADDPDPFKSGDWFLQKDLNVLADQVTLANPFFNTKKIFTDAYTQEVSAGGPRYPQAKKDFLDAIELGALVLNYYGHGNEESFAIERIFEKADAQSLNNRYKYPLFITITCEFTRFDDPSRPTGGEYMYWNKSGGAISMLATTRQIGQSTGIQLNEDIYDYLFAMQNGAYISIAEALRKAKILPGSTNRRVVFYIGDPALKLAIPKPKIVLTKLNDQPIATTTATLQALSLVKFSGEVVDENNTLLTSYNGDLAVQVFDKNLNRLTLDNDNVSVLLNQPKLNFITLGETIYRGNASVANGLFEFSFVVPQDIQIPLGTGRISFYAKSTQPQLQNQSGYSNLIKVGGVNLTAPADTTPPKVKLYMNDTNFVSGGITNNSPIFLAFLEDEHGINTASGIGHDIVAILDNDENNPYILNDYYETENNDYTKGKVTYPFRNLAPGLHTILFKAWDVYNNLITAEIQFVVVGNEELALTHVLNYPNPFVSYTEFWFNHNRPFEPLDVQVQILTISGKLVKTINQTVLTDGFLSREIKWDGKDDFGDKIGKGVYVYKLTVKSTITGTKTEKIEKLVIL